MPHDLRYALRGIRAKPGFTIAVVLTLGLGIGANAAMFSIVDRMLFRPPPMLRSPSLAHRVYLISNFRGKENINGGAQYARYVDLSKWTTSFARTAEFSENDLAIGVGDAAREMKVGAVSSTFFSFFDAPPAIGRYFTAAEDTPPEGKPVAVLTYGYWQTRYGARKDILDSTLQIGSLLYTIVGVAPKGFVGLWPNTPPAAFIPITAHAGVRGNTFKNKDGLTWAMTYNWTFASMMAERKPGVSIAAANADLTNAYARSYGVQREQNPRNTPIELVKPRAIAASILSERGPNESSFARVATWISGVAIIVLLIACANVANLLLARALRRRREIAVRLALGVTYGRLMSQLLTESVLLALMGGVAGILFAQWGGALLRAQFLRGAVQAGVFTDPRTLIFAGVAAVVAGLLTGLVPAFQARRVDLTTDLKAGAREGTHYRSRTRIGLLVLQGALSMALLVGAGLFVRSLRNVHLVPLGYDADPVLLVDMNMRGLKLDSAHTVALRLQLLDAATAIPGVEHATLQTGVPFWSSWSIGLTVAGIDTVGKLGQFNLNAVTPDYFATMGTRILRGRGITPADLAGAPGAMVVSAAMASKIWPTVDAIGQCIKLGSDSLPCTYVVGIAENIKSQRLGDDPVMYYYLSAPQYHPDQGGMFVRMRGVAAPPADNVRRQLQKVMPGASYVTVTPLSDVVSSQTRAWDLGATMFTAFGALALVLAAIGLYSVIAYNVAQRTHELGVRIALGAQVKDVVRMVVSEGVTLGVAGVIIGAGIALSLSHWVASLLFDESPRDPLVFAMMAVLVLGVTIVASVVPARRAARVDPNSALRAE